MIAQMIRAVLFAIATVATLVGFRASRLTKRGSIFSGLYFARRTSEVMPTMSSLRRYLSPSFLLELEIPRSMRENLANKLTWLEKKQKEPSIPDLRDDARIIPEKPHSILTLADGTIHGCFVIDMSVSGAAVSSQIQPEIGTPLAVGACIGRVVRLLPDGFAVKFVERQSRNDLAQYITRFTPPSSAKGGTPLRSGDEGAAYTIGS
jgi:hypothetical protein